MRSHLQGTVPWIIEHIRSGYPQAGGEVVKGKHNIFTMGELRLRQDAAPAISGSEP